MGEAGSTSASVGGAGLQAEGTYAMLASARPRTPRQLPAVEGSMRGEKVSDPLSRKPRGLGEGELQLGELALRIQAGDRAAEDAFFRIQWAVMHSFLRGRLAARGVYDVGANVEDAAQDFAIKVLKSLRKGGFDPARSSGGGIYPWLYMIARRSASDIASKLWRWLPTEPESLSRLPDDASDEFEALLDQAAASQLLQQVECCRGELQPQQREILKLQIEGHTDAEIAEKLGIKVKGVQEQRSRALSKLRECIALLPTSSAPAPTKEG